MHCTCDVHFGVMEIAWAGCADDESKGQHESGVFFLPVLGSVPGAIKAEIELAYHAFVAWFSVFYRYNDVYRSGRLGIEVGSLYVGAEDAVPTARSLMAGALADDIPQALQRRRQTNPVAHRF